MTEAPEQVQTAPPATSPTVDETAAPAAPAPNPPDVDLDAALENASPEELKAILRGAPAIEEGKAKGEPAPEPTPAPEKAEATPETPAPETPPGEEPAAPEGDPEKREEPTPGADHDDKDKARIRFSHLTPLRKEVLRLMQDNPDLMPSEAEDAARATLQLPPRATAPKAEGDPKPESDSKEPQTVAEIEAAIEADERSLIEKTAELDEKDALAIRQRINKRNRELARLEIKAEEAETQRQTKRTEVEQKSLARVDQEFHDAFDPDSKLHQEARASFDELAAVDPSIVNSPTRFEQCVRHAAEKLGIKPATAKAAPLVAKPAAKPVESTSAQTAPSPSSKPSTTRTPAPIGPGGGATSTQPPPGGSIDPLTALEGLSDADQAKAWKEVLRASAAAELAAAR